ncbi:MAG TPA: futalosine hydrolase [Jatrophihabitans sp.]|nr:futalosine hydrolase [Jatrophihabitans sp.]
MPRLLVITAVTAEADAIVPSATVGELAGLAVRRALTPAGLVDVVAGGVGPVEAALSTAAMLAAADYDAVLSAGIGGGFDGVELAVALRFAFADLGAQLADGGFSSVTELGFGEGVLAADAALAEAVAARTGAVPGTVLTVATVTGTAARAEALHRRHPDAVAEGMEGFGVAAAAARAGVPCTELRATSNPVGPRDRQNWQLGPALARLGQACTALLAEGIL